MFVCSLQVNEIVDQRSYCSRSKKPSQLQKMRVGTEVSVYQLQPILVAQIYDFSTSHRQVFQQKHHHSSPDNLEALF